MLKVKYSKWKNVNTRNYVLFCNSILLRMKYPFLSPLSLASLYCLKSIKYNASVVVDILRFCFLFSDDYLYN